MDNLALSMGGSFCLSKITLAINAGGAATVKNTGTISYTINGVFYSASALSAQSIVVSLPSGIWSGNSDGSFTGTTRAYVNSTGTSVTGSTRIYGIFLDSAGAVTVYPGPIVDSGALASGVAPLLWPAPQKDEVCIGAIRVKANSGFTFVPGTTALDNGSLTVAYYDLMTVPTNALTS